MSRWRRRTAWSPVLATAALLAVASSAYASSDAVVVRTTIGSGAGVHSGYATCPSGRDATGGGVALSGGSSTSNNQLISDSGPTDSSGRFVNTTTGSVPVQWYGTGFIQTAGSTAYVWAICGRARTTVVREPIAGSATTGFHSGLARCPAGQRATGGGLGLKDGSSKSAFEFISDDGPLGAGGTFVATTTASVPVQWYATGFIETAGSPAYVWAVCSHLATTVVRKTISSGASSGFHHGYARCPSGQRATGGGIGMSGGSTSSAFQLVSDTGPVNSTGLFQETTTGTTPVQWFGTGNTVGSGTDDYAWAVCG